MVQFNLPENSKILKGKYFKDRTGSKNLKRVHILYSSCLDLNTEIELSMNISDWSIENNVDIIWLNSDHFKDKRILVKIFNHVKPINFLCNSDNKSIKKKDLINISGIEAIDSDSDIIYST